MSATATATSTSTSTSTIAATFARVRRAALTEVDSASLVVWRVAFGALLVLAAARFFTHGWVDAHYVSPARHFTFAGLTWLRPLPAPFAHLHVAAIGMSALCVMLGLRTRLAAATFTILFTWLHLSEQTYYLNHYYLVSLLGALLAALPAFDRRRSAPAWVLWTLRAQVGLVYFFAGVAKLQSDWLLHAQPLRLWLAGAEDFPLFGPLLTLRFTAFIMSWTGALFDLAAVPLLLHRRTRTPAFIALVLFHIVTARLFQLGLFPWLMIANATLLLPSSWPRRLRLGPMPGSPSPVACRPSPVSAPSSPSRLLITLLSTHLLLQLLLPLRHHLLGGNVHWHEQGFRYSWKVMVMEKTGSAEFRVHDPASSRTWIVPPADYLTRDQLRMMSTQPDLVAQTARWIGADFRARGLTRAPPQVFADVFVSLNGRAPRRLIDPTADLAHSTPRGWILQPDLGPPP